MRNQLVKNSLLIACVASISACTGFFDKDNTPKPKALVSFTPQVKTHLLWKASASAGAGKEYLKLTPAMNHHAIFTTSTNGVVTSIAKNNGHTNWQVNTGLMLTTGPGAGDNLIVVGSMHGNVVALSETTGRKVWSTTIDSELMANPAVGKGYVIIKSLDGNVRALSTKDGHKLWSFKQSEPDLILRGASAPLIREDRLLSGFANGSLVSASLASGQINWVQQIAVPEGAFAIERMIDIDADPIIRGHHIYAATYQGNIASLDWRTGNQRWTHKISSYTGMTADDRSIYISDAKSDVWSFGADNGLVNWRQTDLAARNVTGPADIGSYIVVGDAQGYLHWLDKRDGHFAARDYLGSAIYAKPLVDNHVLYALSNNGTLAAYQLGS